MTGSLRSKSLSISLIIPVYNRLHLLEKCLLSVAGQNLLPREIILSDDGSAEDVLSLFHSYKAKSKVPITLVRQQHSGFRLARVRNNAVSFAKGDLLVFIDQDIVIPEDYLADIANSYQPGLFLSGYPIRLTSAQSAALDAMAIESNRLMGIVLPRQKAKIIRQYCEDYYAYLLFRYFKLGKHGAKLRGGVAAITRSDYVKVNGYDENFIGWGSEDDDLGRRLQATGLSGYNFVKRNAPLHLHHEPFHVNKHRANKEYSTQRISQISPQNFTCSKGLSEVRDDLEVWR